VELLDVTGRYLPAPNEGAALAIAAGAALAGDQMGVLIQNSGLGNLINPLTSLVMPYRIGVAVFMSLRGWPDPARDEPQHAVMGSTSHALLDALGVWHWTLDGELSSLETILQQAADRVAAGVPAFVLVPKGTVQKGAAPEGTGRAVPAAFGRAEALRTLAKTVPVSAAVVSTTGYTSRELCAVADRPSHFYMQGSMTCQCDRPRLRAEVPAPARRCARRRRGCLDASGHSFRHWLRRAAQSGARRPR